MADLLPTVLTVLGTVIAAVLVFLGGRYAARQSAKAAARTAEVESRQVDVGEWQKIIEALRGEISRLTERVVSLEADRTLERSAHRSLLTYTRGLLAWIYRSTPDSAPPMPPAAFVDELAYITMERPPT